jgi:diguanylate cyclase (GGDEF)-like protein
LTVDLVIRPQRPTRSVKVTSMTDDIHLVRSADLDARYDSAARATLVPAFCGLAAFSAIFAAYLLLAPVLGASIGAPPATDAAFDEASVVLGLSAAVVCAVLVGLTLIVWRSRRTITHAQAWVAGALLLEAVFGLVALFVSRDITASLVLVVVVGVIGTTVLATRWLVALVYTIWVSWLATLAAAQLAAQCGPWVLAMVMVTGVAVATVLGRRRTVDALSQAEDSADQASVRDPLTGLVNRRGLAMMGGQIVESARRQGDAVHCVFVDIDQLRHVNEVEGRDAGDEVVVAVADALRSVTRATDVVARWGGDEFCVVGPGAGMAPMELERRVRERVLLDPPVDDLVWSPKVCAGGAMLAPWDTGNLDTLLGKADQEMYLRRALRRGGPRRSPFGGRAAAASTETEAI